MTTTCLTGDSGAAWTIEDPPRTTGSHALVYRGTGPGGVVVAVKLARLPGRAGGWLEDEATEARAWGEHPVVGPRIVPILDVGRWEGRWFHVTPWQATSVSALAGRGAAEDRRALARALVETVVAARREGLVHPNLHAGNVFAEARDGGWSVFLADPSERPALTPSYSTRAIPASMAVAAPEQVAGHLPGDDAFSLAALVFQVLVGRPPDAPLANALDPTRRAPLTPADRAALRDVAEPALIDALARLLAPDHERRERDPAVLLGLFGPPVARRPRWPPVALAVAAVAVTVAIVGVAGEEPVGPPSAYPVVDVPPGTFVMGSADDDPTHGPDEGAHRVTLTRGFRLGVREVTQAELRAAVGEDPVHGTRRWGRGVWGACSPYHGVDLVGDDAPAVCVSWAVAVRLANAWSAADGLEPAYDVDGDDVAWDRDADGWRLPTEAEWEWAARAGGGAYGPARDASELCLFSNIAADVCDDGVPGLMKVASLRPNAYGLYDMLGNAQEWTWDRYGPYPDGPVTDPVGPDDGALRVDRGGSWFRTARTVSWRSADAPWVRAPSMGVRLARNAR